jgi:hypothetical protein
MRLKEKNVQVITSLRKKTQYESELEEHRRFERKLLFFLYGLTAAFAAYLFSLLK